MGVPEISKYDYVKHRDSFGHMLVWQCMVCTCNGGKCTLLYTHVMVGPSVSDC